MLWIICHLMILKHYLFHFILLVLLSSLIKILFDQIIESDRGLQDHLSCSTFYVTLIKFPFSTFLLLLLYPPSFDITLIRDITKLYTCRKISWISHLPHPFSRLREDKTGKGGGGCCNTGISYCNIKVPKSQKEEKKNTRNYIEKGYRFVFIWLSPGGSPTLYIVFDSNRKYLRTPTPV